MGNSSAKQARTLFSWIFAYGRWVLFNLAAAAAARVCERNYVRAKFSNTLGVSRSRRPFVVNARAENTRGLPREPQCELRPFFWGRPNLAGRLRCDWEDHFRSIDTGGGLFRRDGARI